MSKVSARPHQAIIVLTTTPQQIVLIRRIQRKWFGPSQIEGIAQCVLNLALINWKALAPFLEADSEYADAEGFDLLSDVHEARITALTRRGFVP